MRRVDIDNPQKFEVISRCGLVYMYRWRLGPIETFGVGMGEPDDYNIYASGLRSRDEAVIHYMKAISEHEQSK